MKLHFGHHRDQPASLIGELPLMLALFASACGFFWTEDYFDLLPGTGIMPILPWFFAFLFSGFFIPWRPHRPYSSGFALAQTRDRLGKIYGWSVAFAASYLSYRGLSDGLASLFNGGALESIVMPCAFFTALAVALLMGVLLHNLPNRLHNARLAGRLAAEPAREVLTPAGAWLAVILLLVCHQSLIVQTTSLPSYLSVSPENLCHLLLASFVSIALFALIRLWLTPAVPLTISIGWPKADQSMLTKARDTAISPTYWLVFDRPLQSKTDGALIDRIVSSFENVPIVLVAPPGGDLFGEHLYLADQQGRLKALLPRLEIELDDWKRQLPPSECWSALEYRELYPADRLLPVAVKTLQSAQDRVVLVNDVNLERWRGLLADESACVLVFDVDSNEIPERISGYRTLTVSGNKMPKFDFEVTKPSYHRPVVFISYVNIYRDYAQRLTNALRQDCEVLSDLELQAGDQWKLKLAEMLESADVVVVLAGDTTAVRRYPMEEINRTINLGKLLVPVFVNRFIETRELLIRQCANTDTNGKILYLSEYQGEKLDRVIRLTAKNIVKAMASTQSWHPVEVVNQSVSPAYRPVKLPQLYVIGPPVFSEYSFVGRAKLLEQLFKLWSQPDRNPTVALVGQRRMGKTSLLHKIQRDGIPETNLLPVLVDIEGAADEWNMLMTVACAVARILNQPEPSFEKDNFYSEFTEFLMSMGAIIAPRRILLMLDEAGRMFKDDMGERMPSLFRAIRQNQSFPVLFLFAGERRMMYRDYLSITSPAFNDALLFTVSYLSKSESSILLEEPVLGILKFSPEALDKAYHLTNGHPFLLQIMGQELISLFDETVSQGKERSSYVYENDIEQAAIRMEKSRFNFFDYCWHSHDDNERRVLSILAQATDETNFLYLTTLESMANAHDMDRSEVRSIVDRLVEEEFLSREEFAIRFSVPLYRHWVVVNKVASNTINGH